MQIPDDMLDEKKDADDLPKETPKVEASNNQKERNRQTMESLAKMAQDEEDEQAAAEKPKETPPPTEEEKKKAKEEI